MNNDALAKIDGILMMLREGCYNGAKASVTELKEMLKTSPAQRMKQTILQIIPAPANLWAELHPDERYPEDKAYSPVMALALIETETTWGELVRTIQTVHMQKRAGLIITNSKSSDPCSGYKFTDKPDPTWNEDDE